MPVKKVYLIVNPYGGKGRGKIVLKAALGKILHNKEHHRSLKKAFRILTLSSSDETAMQTKHCALLSIT